MKKRNRKMIKYYIMAFVWVLLMEWMMLNYKSAKVSMIDPYISSYNVTPIKEPQRPTPDQVKEYIKIIFGNNWKTAWAISQAECTTTRKEWPVCVNSWEKERSIGMFQINIAAGNGLGQKVHWDKIPGETLAQKELWLADYRNNVIMAYKISEGGRNWNAWSAFTNKSYLSYMK